VNRQRGLFLVWRFWWQQVSVLLRVEQEFFKALGEFEASGNSAPASRNHFVVRSDTWIGCAGSAPFGFHCALKSICNVFAKSLEHDTVPTSTTEYSSTSVIFLQKAACDDVTELPGLTTL
jgi:hypothetical protein